jgi:hypothetical protein
MANKVHFHGKYWASLIWVGCHCGHRLDFLFIQKEFLRRRNFNGVKNLDCVTRQWHLVASRKVTNIFKASASFCSLYKGILYIACYWSLPWPWRWRKHVLTKRSCEYAVLKVQARRLQLEFSPLWKPGNLHKIFTCKQVSMFNHKARNGYFHGVTILMCKNKKIWNPK